VSALGYALLCALHKQPLTGYELVRRMRRPIGYYWTARQSQIYPELGRLSELGLITSSGESGPGPHQRRTHKLAAAGRAVLAEWLARPPEPRPLRDELVLKTYAVRLGDPVAMRALYLAEAERHQQRLDEYRRQEADLVDRGAVTVDHPDFGSYATLVLGQRYEELHAQWCQWLADSLTDSPTPATLPLPTPPFRRS
jgi:DNA-binding PadR family transcriptional regulator